VDFTLPAGTYTALKVTLGEGRGQNFFCMLYPSLCITPSLGERVERGSDAYGEAAFLMITEEGYGVRFRTLELLSALFG
jgi:stage II sporulation protein R